MTAVPARGSLAAGKDSSGQPATARLAIQKLVRIDVVAAGGAALGEKQPLAGRDHEGAALLPGVAAGGRLVVAGGAGAEAAFDGGQVEGRADPVFEARRP